MNILFPTLISCSFDCETTRAILQTEMSLELIANYIEVSSFLICIFILFSLSSNRQNQVKQQ
jgi:hypothetical protein